MSRVRILAVAGAIVMTSAPAFAASFVGASVNTNANTFLGDVFQGNPGISVTHNASASSLPATPLTAEQSQSFSSVPQSSPFVGQDKVTSTDNASASFASADVGSFHADSSWLAILPDHRGAGFAEMDNADRGIGLLPAFDYQFDATGDDNLFTMTFGVSPTSNRPFLQRGDWDMNLMEDGQSVKFLALSDGGTGTFSAALVAGHHYELRLRDEAGLVLPESTFLNGVDAQNTADFGWIISHVDTGGGGGGGGVPEPSTWALVILGFGLTGASLRRAAAARRFA